MTDWKHHILGKHNYEKKLPKRVDKPIRIDEAKITNRESTFVGISFSVPTCDEIFNSIRQNNIWTRPTNNPFHNNPYYDHPDIMNKYRDRKFKIPPKCPRCQGTIHYMGDYVSHNNGYHGAPFSNVISELEEIIKNES